MFYNPLLPIINIIKNFLYFISKKIFILLLIIIFLAFFIILSFISESKASFTFTYTALNGQDYEVNLYNENNKPCIAFCNSQGVPTFGIYIGSNDTYGTWAYSPTNHTMNGLSYRWWKRNFQLINGVYTNGSSTGTPTERKWST